MKFRLIAIILFLYQTLSLYAQDNDCIHLDSVTVRADSARGEVGAYVCWKYLSADKLPLFYADGYNQVSSTKIAESHESSVLPLVEEQTPGLFLTQRGVMGYGVSSGGSGSISIRGLGSGAGRVLVVVDGHPQYMGLMGHPIADICQTQSLDQVSVTRGPSSMLWGANAMGGVVYLTTKQPNRDSAMTDASLGYGSYNTLQGQVGITNRQGKWGSAVNGSYNRTDGHHDDMGFKQYAGYGKLTCDFNKHWQMGGDFNLNKYNANNPGAEDNRLKDAEQDITRGATSVWLNNYYYFYGSQTHGQVTGFYNWGNHLINDGYSAQGGIPLDYRYHSRDYVGGFSARQSYHFGNDRCGNEYTTDIRAGLDYLHYGGEAWNEYVAGEKIGTTETLADKRIDECSAFALIGQYLTSWLRLSAGARYDHHSLVGGEWIPYASMSFPFHRIDSNYPDFSLNASKGFRNPTLKELYMFKPANENLESESIWNYEIDYSQYLFSQKFSHQVCLFYITGDNLITTQMVNGKPLNTNTGAIENMGVEYICNLELSSKWKLDANYSYLHMEHPVIASPEHKLYVGGRFAPKRWRISSGLEYISGLYTEVGDQCSQTEYVLWSLRAQFFLCHHFSVWVKGENLLNQDYEINAGYPMPGATIMVGAKLHIQ